MLVHLVGDCYELHGMSSVRFIEGDIVPYNTNMPKFCKKAGYIFTFNKGNDTRFNATGQLSDLQMTKPSREEFVKRHGPDVFSVEKVGDKTFGTNGTKRFGTFTEVFVEIGSRFKKGKKKESFRKGHLPKAVGKANAKSFETSKGKFKVTRLILD